MIVTSNVPLDFSQVQAVGNRLIGQINALREVAPIFWSETEHAWIISGHAEVTEGYSGALPLSAGRYKMFEMLVPDKDERDRLIPNLLRYFPRIIINMDPPEHTRVRKLMTKAFSRKVVEAYRPLARDVILNVLDGLKQNGEIEFVEDVARTITGRNILRIMGLKDEALYLPKLKEWAYIANAGASGRPNKDTLRRTDTAFREMGEAFQVEIEDRRANPGDDFVSMLVHASEEGDSFKDDEIIAQLIVTLIAGHDTTLNTMALSINALSKEHAALEYMRANPDALLNSVMELMRYIAMSTAMARIVADDFVWKGNQLKKGQLVHLMIMGANRDPRVFAEPERLDLTRNQDNNLAFAPGVHHCIGHLFAKMQLTEFFPEFLKRFDFDVLDQEMQFGGGLTFRGPQALRVKISSRIEAQ
jgi:cytochrome P450